MVRGGLSWSQNRELGLPISEDIRLDTDDLGDLADAEIEFIGKRGLSHSVPRLGRVERVDRLFQHWTRLEGEHMATRNNDLFAGLRISPFTRTLGVNNKVAEAGDFDFLSLFETPFEQLKNRLDHIRGFFLGKADLFVNALD